MLSRRKMLTAGVGLAAGAALAACSDKGSANGKWTGGPGASGNAGDGGGAKTSAKLTITPAADAKDISPATPVVVAIEGGKLQTVAVSAGGKAIAGTLSDDQLGWKSTGPLAYGQTYTVAVSAVDSAGTTVTQNASFATIKPTGVSSITFQANPMLSLKTGGTYGIGQPVIVFFSKAPKDRAAAEQAMQVTTEPAVQGKWHWVSGQAAHWRPEHYWAKGTRVKVTTNLLGVDLGGGVYGSANSSTNFVIGPSRIAIADSNTHQMLCYIDGVMVKQIPVSMGKGGTTTGSKGETIDFWTRSGVHVLLTKEPQTTMSSASYGITDKNNPNFYSETIKLACRISLAGEYVHLADWNIPSQGKANTSHGCVNVAPANAQWFYNTFDIGDVVEVKNTPKQLPIDDGIGDWNVPYAQW